MTYDALTPPDPPSRGQNSQFAGTQDARPTGRIANPAAVCSGLRLDELESVGHRAAHVQWAGLTPNQSTDDVVAAADALQAAGCPEAVHAWLSVPAAFPREYGPDTEFTGCLFVLGVFRTDGFGTQDAAVEITERMPHLAGLDRDWALRLIGAWYQFGEWLAGFDDPQSTLGIDAAQRLLATTTVDDLRAIGDFKDGARPLETLSTAQVEYVEFQRFCTRTSIPAWTVLNSAVARTRAANGHLDSAMAMLGASIASGSPSESDYDDLSWLCERTGDLRHAAVIASEGLASGILSPTLADRLQRRRNRCAPAIDAG